MAKSRRMFTSESVTEGHPDKVCDQISDAILDAILEKDPTARVACETVCTTGLVQVMGEITTTSCVDIPKIARQVIKDIGYDGPQAGFDGDTCAVVTAIDEQSPDIAIGVDKLGAGDQGMMFGYATKETPDLMPLPIYLAHQLAMRLAEVRKDGTMSYLRPDGKTQVTVEYDEFNNPKRIDTIVVSAQHSDGVGMGELSEDILKHVISPVIPEHLIYDGVQIYVNPTGRFVIGGPQADTGLTGRKIIVDTYGGSAPHGGGAFSGKDPTKVDRSAAYAARWVAKNIVAAGLADKCQVQIAYAIGVAQPVSIRVDTFGTAKIPDEAIEAAVYDVFDLSPAAIIKDLGLRAPIYRQVAAYGHFGRPELDLPWERTNRVLDILKATEHTV